MKKLTRKNSGFTLIEIIVVLIIVGVLAAIALPNLFGNIAKSKGGEALASLGSMKATIMACCQAKQSCAACTTTKLGTSGAFHYQLAGSDETTPAYDATTTAKGSAAGFALRASAGSAADTTNFIKLISTDAGASVACTAGGSYQGLC